MGRRDLLSAEERRLLFGVPVEWDALARRYTFDPGDLELIHTRREDRKRPRRKSEVSPPVVALAVVLEGK